MGHFAASETQGDLYFVTIAQKSVHRPHFDVVIMRIDTRTHLDLFDLDGFLFLTGFRFAFLIFVFQLAVIEHFADRRAGIGGHLYEVETFSCGFCNGFGCWHNAKNFTIWSNKPDFRHFYHLVDAPRILLGLRLLVRSSCDGRISFNYGSADPEYLPDQPAGGADSSVSLATASVKARIS